MQPDARFKMPSGLPVVPEIARHACIADLPQQDAFMVYLLNYWFSHKKREPKPPALRLHFRKGHRH